LGDGDRETTLTYIAFLMRHLSIVDQQRVLATEEYSMQSPHEGLCLVCLPCSHVLAELMFGI
jgi:hypothetical protein